jgi:hypothetical protein
MRASPSTRRRSGPIAASIRACHRGSRSWRSASPARSGKANYEWFAHAPLAIKAGIEPAAIEAIRTGATPTFSKSDEQAIYDFASELVKTRRVSNATFERAKKELGETSVIDLVGIIGYYSLVSVTLNAFELPLPDGEKVPFDYSLKPSTLRSLSSLERRQASRIRCVHARLRRAMGRGRALGARGHPSRHSPGASAGLVPQDEV